MTQSIQVLNVGNIAVRQHAGLFSLNDLHRAAGSEKRHQPSDFIRIDQTQALIEALKAENLPTVETVIGKGKAQGTYACRELVIAYAAWISAAFHLKVIRVFLATVQPQANPAIDYDRISPAQAQDLKELVHSIAESKVQGFAETWARLHKKFRVNSYLELPATRFEEARDYLLGKLPEEAPQPQPTAFTQAIASAHSSALQYFSNYRAAVDAGQRIAEMPPIPTEVLEGLVAESLMQHQFLAGFDYRTGQMDVRLVPSGASVFDFQNGDFAQAVSAIPTKRLPDLQDALTKRIALHLGAIAH